MAGESSSRRRRLLKLAGMTASVVGRYTSAQVKGLFLTDEARARERRLAHLHSGGRIAQTLGELKGAVMKVGQMVSIAADVLPTELAEALRTLQREAPPMPYETIAEQVRSELGAAPERLFRSFAREPFAAASIGQVHRAVLDDGREVVCKVQYPDIGAAVDSDLWHLRLALRASVLARVNRAALDATFAELRTRLHEELDYCLEADNLRLFRAYHARHPFVVVPEVIGERSAQRVLTLAYEPGDPLHRLVDCGYVPSVRHRIAEQLVTLLAAQVFELGAFHADPHPGNFACRPDGTLIVYDFGCVKTLPRETVCAARELILAGLADDLDGIERALVHIGVRDLTGPPVEPGYYRRWLELFRRSVLRPGVVDWGESMGLRRQIAAELPGLAARMRSFKPAKHLVFLNRTVAGLYGNLRSLGVELDLLAILCPYLERFDADRLRANAASRTRE